MASVSAPAIITRSGRICSPQEVLPRNKGKNVVSEEVVVVPTDQVKGAEFEKLQKMFKPTTYNVVEQLEKAPSKISMMDLLLTSELHQKALLDVLKQAYVPKDTEEEGFRNIIGAILAPSSITFSDGEAAGQDEHAEALHITVQHQDTNIPKVLVDNGSAINVIPKYILNMLNVDHARVRENRTSVRAFDGTSREVLGTITLPITVGPAVVDMEFNILDIKPSFNMLLGRPGIHKLGAVPSTLHQTVKFIHQGRVIAIKGDHAQQGIVIPHISAEAVYGVSDFHSLEYVNATFQCRAIGEEMEYPTGLTVYDLGFGLGYEPSRREMKIRRERRKENRQARVDEKALPELPLIIPHSLEAFIKPGALQQKECLEKKEKEEGAAEPEAPEGYGLVEMFARAADNAELTPDLEGLSICAIEDDAGIASLPHPSRGEPLDNWTVDDQPERLPQK